MSKVQIQGRVRRRKLRDDEKLNIFPSLFYDLKKQKMLRKPNWIKIKITQHTSNIDQQSKKTLRKNNLTSVCEEAKVALTWLNVFKSGTATL